MIMQFPGEVEVKDHTFVQLYKGYDFLWSGPQVMIAFQLFLLTSSSRMPQRDPNTCSLQLTHSSNCCRCTNAVVISSVLGHSSQISSHFGSAVYTFPAAVQMFWWDEFLIWFANWVSANLPNIDVSSKSVPNFRMAFSSRQEVNSGTAISQVGSDQGSNLKLIYPLEVSQIMINTVEVLSTKFVFILSI